MKSHSHLKGKVLQLAGYWEARTSSSNIRLTLLHHSICFMSCRIPGADLSPSQAPWWQGSSLTLLSITSLCSSVFCIMLAVLCTPGQQTHLFFGTAFHVFVYHLIILQQGRMANTELCHPAAVAQSFRRVSVGRIHSSSSVWEHPHSNRGRNCGHSFRQGIDAGPGPMDARFTFWGVYCSLQSGFCSYNYATAWVKSVWNAPCTCSAHLHQVSVPSVLHLSCLVL